MHASSAIGIANNQLRLPAEMNILILFSKLNGVESIVTIIHQKEKIFSSLTFERAKSQNIVDNSVARRYHIRIRSGKTNPSALKTFAK